MSLFLLTVELLVFRCAYNVRYYLTDPYGKQRKKEKKAMGVHPIFIGPTGSILSLTWVDPYDKVF